MIPLDERTARIRENERISHTEIYSNEKLYETDSWLKKPIKTVCDIVTHFDGYDTLHVLDLGCGVGRNAIYIAETYKGIQCTVDCVDLLPIAIEKLLEYAKQYGVSEHINGIIKPIEEYEIEQNSYDLILAISALEHIDSQESFVKKLFEIKNGMRNNGIVCLVVNSNIKETIIETSKETEAQFEVNLPTDVLQKYITEVFDGWQVLKSSVVHQEYIIPRGAQNSRLASKVITYAVRKGE